MRFINFLVCAHRYSLILGIIITIFQPFLLVLQVNHLKSSRIPLRGHITTVIFWGNRFVIRTMIFDVAWYSIDKDRLWAIDPRHSPFFKLRYALTMWSLNPDCIYSADSRIYMFKWWCNIDTLYVGLIFVYRVCQAKVLLTFLMRPLCTLLSLQTA